MSPGPDDPTQPYDPTFGLTAGVYILAEWLRIIGIVIGVGALPFLIGLIERIVAMGAGGMPFLNRLYAGIMNLFWVLPLAAGGLVTCAGLYLTLKEQDSNPAPDHRDLDAGAGLVLPWNLSAQMRLDIAGQSYKNYQQPEVNLLLDYIGLARNYYQPLTDCSGGWLLDMASQLPKKFSREKLTQPVKEAIAAGLPLERSLENWLAQAEVGQFLKLRDFLVMLNNQLAGPHQSAGEFVAWLVKQLADYDLGYPPDGKAKDGKTLDGHAQAIQKFIMFLGSVELVHIDPCDLPEQLAVLERLLPVYIRLALDYCETLTELRGSQLLTVTSQVIKDFSPDMLKMLEKPVAAAITNQLPLNLFIKKWLDDAGLTPPAKLNEDQALKFAKLRGFLEKLNGDLAKLNEELTNLNRELAKSGQNKSAEEFVEEMENGLYPSRNPLQKTSTTASISSSARPREAAISFISVPNLLIALGLLILLPGFVTLIALSGGAAYPQRIAWFFSAPAVLVWMAAEGAGVYFAWIDRTAQRWLWATLVKSILQAIGAALILVYLALSYSQLLHPAEGQAAYPLWVDWLLAAGGGLAVLSAILASLGVVAQRRAPSAKTPAPPAMEAAGTRPAARSEVEKQYATPAVPPGEASRARAASKGSGQAAFAEKSEGKEKVP